MKAKALAAVDISGIPAASRRAIGLPSLMTFPRAVGQIPPGMVTSNSPI
jgi:hypothetical protein